MTRWGFALLLFPGVGCALPPPAPPPYAPQPAVAPAVSAAPPPCEGEACPGGDDGQVAPDDEPDDGADPYADGQEPPRAPASSPLLTLGDDELGEKVKKDPASLGSISIGRTNGGLLFNGMQMPKGERWTLVDPSHAWGTKETVDALVHCIDRVNERYPGTPPILIGHISAKNGGHLSPHISHQSGRDADVGYYHQGTSPRGFIRANAHNLDLARTWALIKTAVKETDVEMILVDTSIQRLVADHALRASEDPALVDQIFQSRGKNARAPVRHAKGHGNHLHFRWHNPVAEELGRRAQRFLPHPAPPRAPGAPPAAASIVYAQHRARSGDTLVILARRYGTSVEEIQRANGLQSTALRAGVVYRIPQKAPPRPVARAAPPARKPAPKPAGPHKGPAAPQR